MYRSDPAINPLLINRLAGGITIFYANRCQIAGQAFVLLRNDDQSHKFAALQKNFTDLSENTLSHSLLIEGAVFGISRMLRNRTLTSESLSIVEMATVTKNGGNGHESIGERDFRLDTKLKRELGEQALALLQDERTEDIMLNPDSSLWVKHIGQGFV